MTSANEAGLDLPKIRRRPLTKEPWRVLCPIAETAVKRIVRGNRLLAVMEDGTELTLTEFEEDLPDEIQGQEYDRDFVVALLLFYA